MSYMVRIMFARALILVAFALLAVGCDVAPLPQAAVEERVLPDLEAQAQAEESCGQAGEACCEGEACAEGHECSEGVCVYPFLEPREPSAAE